MPPNRFESEVESFLEGSHGDRTHIKRADHHTVTPLCGTLLSEKALGLTTFVTTHTKAPQKLNTRDPHDAHSKQQDLAKQQPNAPSNINDQAPLVWRAPEG